MLPTKLPNKINFDLLGKTTLIEEHEEDNQHEIQAQAINDRNQRIIDKAAGIVKPKEPISQIPVNKSKLKQKAPDTSIDWNPYD